MKKVFITVLAVLAVFAGLYAIVISMPRITKPEELNAILSSAQERWDKGQIEAADPAKNGYTSSTFLPFWGRNDGEATAGSAAETAVKAWLQYSTLLKEEPVDHKSLQGKPEYGAALSGFEKLAPELVTEMRKPVFVAPDKELSATTLVLNFQAVRDCARAVVALAEARVAQGKPAEAASLLGSAALLGQALQQNHGIMLGEMVSIAVQTSACDAFVGLLGPDTELTSAEWKAVATDFVTSIPDRDQIPLTLGTELLAVRNSFAAWERGDIQEDTYEGPLAAPPGLMQRERRIYSNHMVDAITSMAEGKQAVAPANSHPSTWDHITGVHGIASVMIPNFQRAQTVADLNRKRMIAMALLAGVRAYKVETGRSPQNLRELDASGVPMPSQASLQADRVAYTADGNVATLTLPYFKNPHTDSESTPRINPFGPSDWADESQPGVLTYRLAAQR